MSKQTESVVKLPDLKKQLRISVYPHLIDEWRASGADSVVVRVEGDRLIVEPVAK